MNIKDKLEAYQGLEQEIHEYFGYKQDWVVIPMDFCLDDYWFLTGEDSGGQCVHSPDAFTPANVEAGTKLYSSRIYTQRFLPKWVYRGAEYTMVCVDTQTDGNKFLQIFSNDKECHDEAIKEVYKKFW